MKTVLIEIAGIDGAGKSTLIAGLRSRCARAEISSVERRPRLSSVHLWNGATTSPELELPSARFWMSFGELAATVAPDLQHLAAISPPRSLIFVDGYLTAIFAEGLAASITVEEREKLLALLRRMSAPDIAIVLEVDAAEALRRIRARGGHDFILSSPDPRTSLERRQANLLHAARGVHYPALIADANVDRDVLLEHVWDRIQPHLEQLTR